VVATEISTVTLWRKVKQYGLAHSAAPVPESAHQSPQLHSD
jgi:hypothetical protein